MSDESILDSTKKSLGLSADYTVFDTDIISYINTVLGTLQQLGIGPDSGFEIIDSNATWEQFLGTYNGYNPVHTYVGLRVRLLFDPPATSYHITAIQEQIKELEWRLNVQRESRSTYLLGMHKKITGNLGDEHIIKLGNPEGQTFIKASGTYSAEFVSDNGRKSEAVLDVSQIANGILRLHVTIKPGQYIVRSLNPRRTVFTLEVTAT